MPWPFYMAQWLYDPVASSLSGSVQFKKPYPQSDWIDDMEWNELPVNAMRHVTEADRVFSMPAENWTEKEDVFFRDMLDGLEKMGIDYA